MDLGVFAQHRNERIGKADTPDCPEFLGTSYGKNDDTVY
jgi:hypothetical protein